MQDMHYAKCGEEVVECQGHIKNSSGGFCSRHCSKSRMAVFSLIGIAVILVVSLTPCWSSLLEDSNTNSFRPIRVAAFNIQRFGKSFMSDQERVSNLLKILTRCDIVLIQEVRDSSHTALKNLNKQLNNLGESWTYISSAPLGRSKHYKEQYTFFYKTLSVKFMGSHQVNDSESDIYEREPFAVDFEYASVSQKSRQRVILMALHAKPNSVEEELQELPATIRAMAAVFPEAGGVVAMGDFNADCSYLSARARHNLEIFTSRQFVSLIPESADTTVSKNTDCAYDRIVVYGKSLDARKGSVYDFEAALKLDANAATELSDHYPVEFVLY